MQHAIQGTPVGTRLGCNETMLLARIERQLYYQDEIASQYLKETHLGQYSMMRYMLPSCCDRARMATMLSWKPMARYMPTSYAASSTRLNRLTATGVSRNQAAWTSPSDPAPRSFPKVRDSKSTTSTETANEDPDGFGEDKEVKSKLFLVLSSDSAC